MKLIKKGKETTSTIVEIVRKKKLLSRYTILIISLFISACYFNLLQLPTEIVTGGTSGIAIIINAITGISPSLIIFVLSVVLLIIGAFLLGIEKTSGALISTIVYPIFVELTSHLGDYITFDLSDKILISIYIGILSGVTTGMVYKVGFSNGGFAIVSEILARYKKISISSTSFVTNMIIVAIGGFTFGWDMVMYAAIILYIYTFLVYIYDFLQ